MTPTQNLAEELRALGLDNRHPPATIYGYKDEVEGGTKVHSREVEIALISCSIEKRKISKESCGAIACECKMICSRRAKSIVEAIVNGVPLPVVEVAPEGVGFILRSGFHRYHISKARGFKKIPVYIRDDYW